MHQATVQVQASGQGLLDITRQIEAVVRASGVVQGMCNVFMTHTSASLCIQENADPSARADLEEFLQRLVPFEKWFRHTAEGRDDMPSHIKSALTNVSLAIPVCGGELALGTWQGIFLWEHRDYSGPRRLIVTVWS